MKNIFISVIFISAISLSTYATDTLKLEKPKKFSVKSNMAALLFRGYNLQVEYIATKHIGLWIETARHCEKQSMLNSSIRETNFIAGINYYGVYKNADVSKIHNGPYIGPYFKYKKGSYNENKNTDYIAIISGMQGGIQSALKHNIIFNMGMAFGLGYFTKRKELEYSTFYDKYKMPLLDFRANISFGYMF